MKLSDLLKNAGIGKKKSEPSYSYVGDDNHIVDKSISKSSPAFKATQPSNAPTIPGAPADGFKFMTRMPQQPTDFSGMPAAARGDLQGVDYFKNLAMNAVKPETRQAAVNWLDRNMGGYDTSMTETPTTDTMTSTDTVGGNTTDFSTTTSNVAYSAEKMNELFGTKSPEDLFAMREKLRRDAALAKAGLLPEEEYMQYQGLPGLQGERGYTYDDTMALNGATADIFSNAASKADQAIKDSGLNKTSTGLEYSFGSNPALDVILGSGKFTKDQKGLIIGAIQSGQDPTTVILNQARSLMANPIATEVSKTQQGLAQLQEVQSALADYYAADGDTSLLKGNWEKVINKLGKTSDPKLAAINSRIAKALQKYRNAVSGTAYSVQEGADIASIFPGINKGKELNDALVGAGIDSLQSDIDTAYGEVLGTDIYNALKTGGNNNTQNSDIQTINGVNYKKRPDGSYEVVAFNQVGSGTNKAPKVVAGYDISSYATDPNHERSVAAIYQRTPSFKTASDIDMVIRKVAPKSKITGNMVATAASTYGVDPKMVYAIMLQDSSLGTAGMGARNNNPGNIGQYDNLGRPVAGYQTLQGGVNAVAKWLSKKKVNTPNSNYA